MNNLPVIVLTDTEWMDLIDKEREALPVCCANLSSLRDCIVKAARNGGRMSHFDVQQMHEKLDWYLEGHSINSLLRKVCEQVNYELPVENNPTEDQLMDEFYAAAEKREKEN